MSELHQRKAAAADTAAAKPAAAAPAPTAPNSDTPASRAAVVLRQVTTEARKLGWTGPVQDGLSRGWWIYDDCCGLVCAMVTLGLHVFAYWAQWQFIFAPWLGLYGAPHLLYTVLAFLAVASHTRCQFTAPGVVPSTLKPPPPPELETAEEQKYYEMLRSRLSHSRTRTIKPKTSHYCHEVDAVVIKMDHYCPWVNNVVALFTQKYFLLFIFYTCLTCIFCGCTLGVRFVTCYRAQHHGRGKYSNWDRTYHRPAHCDPTTTDTVVSICNAVEAVIFAIFTIAMGCDQAEAVAENTNYIDRLQKKKGDQQTYMKSLEDIFGEPFGWRWFLPLAPTPQLRKTFQRYCKSTWTRLACFPDEHANAFLEDVCD